LRDAEFETDLLPLFAKSGQNRRIYGGGSYPARLAATRKDLRFTGTHFWTTINYVFSAGYGMLEEIRG
jgi:hypothetical protein